MSATNGFFDFASATPLADKVLSDMSPYFANSFYNPSALYSASLTSKDALAESRKLVALELGVKYTEIIFTSGCTEANNLAVQGILNAYPGATILTSSIEHESILKPAQNYPNKRIPVTSSGIVDLASLESLIDDSVVLVSVMYINNELGTVQPLRKIADTVAKVRKSRGSGALPLYLHTDAAQAPNTQSINCNALGVDLMSINGGKIYGPKGSGCLFVSKNVEMNALQLGGGQEFGMRSGTENIPSIVGFASAMGDASKRREAEHVRLEKIQKLFENEVVLFGGTVNGLGTERSPAISSILFKGYDNETIVYKLSNIGTSVASGSACHAKSGEKSYVLSAIGLSEQDSLSTIRVSFGRTTSEEDVRMLLKALKQVLAQI